MSRKIQYIILLGLVVLSSQHAFAKNSSKDTMSAPKFKHAFSFNFSEPIIKLISKNASLDSTLNLKAPILYLSTQSKRFVYRIGGRAVMKNTSNQSDIFSDKKMLNYNRYDITLSALKKKQVGNKLGIAYGLSLNSFYISDKKKYDSGFDRVTFKNQTLSAALGPQFLLQYQINQRLSVFTEYLLAFQYATSYTGKEFSAFPDQNYANDRSTQMGIQFDYPISIYLTYHF